MQVTWTDSIVTDADIAFCGPLEHNIKDMSSGSAVALAGDPFTTIDL